MNEMRRSSASSAPPAIEQSAVAQPAGVAAEPLSFHAHLELLHVFLNQRSAIVAKIDQLLNAQKKPLDYQQNLALLAQQFKDGFFGLAALTPEQTRLRDQLERAHWQSGFKPRAAPGNDIIDAAALMQRAFHFWRQTRWPGQKGRVRYAHTLFNVHLLRCITLLNMRLWDDGTSVVGERLAQVQALLEALWRSAPADQPVLVRDARWLFPVAMSPTTDTLAGYFEVAQSIAETFSAADQLETQKAWVQTAGGHLRSQLRHLCAQQGVSLDEHDLVLLTRRSNTLDIALLMQGLVTLLKAYRRAIEAGNDEERVALAQAAFQGVSPDPQLFLRRLDLLAPYSMIEHLFITTDSEGHAVYTATGQRHLQLLREYKALVSSLNRYLHEDCLRNAAAADAYSPYGALYGFASNVLELMALKTLQLDGDTSFSMEDAFSTGDQNKRAWVNQWRDLPHVSREVVKQFEYPEAFANSVQARIAKALQEAVDGADTNAVPPLGRVFVVSGEDARAMQELAAILPLAARHVVSSDPQLVAAQQAEFQNQQDLLYCQLEGEFVVSYRTAGGWVGISKDMLTDVAGAGQQVKLVALPATAGEVLQLMCPDFVVLR